MQQTSILGCFTDNVYKKITNKACWTTYGKKFRTLDQGKSACNIDDNCAVVHDWLCTGDSLKLCQKETTTPSTISSCVHEKQGTFNRY